jgi:hypothetical protein
MMILTQVFPQLRWLAIPLAVFPHSFAGIIWQHARTAYFSKEPDKFGLFLSKHVYQSTRGLVQSTSCISTN